MIRTYFRRKRQFLGIRSHPSFVKAITVAFETSAASLEGLLRSGAGEGKDTLEKWKSFKILFSEFDCSKEFLYNCPTCSLIRSDQIFNNPSSDPLV